MNEDVTSSLIEFPCRFPIKIIARDFQGFESFVCDIAHKQVGKNAEISMRTNSSKTKTFKSITLTVPVNSQQQLDALYQQFSQDKRITMVL